MTKPIALRFSLLLALLLAAFAPVFPALVHAWLSYSNNSHGVLVPFISAYLVWTKRDKLASTETSSSMWGLVLLLLSMALYLLGYAAKIAVVPRCMLVFSLAGLILFCLGSRFLKQLAFPIFFLLFMVPIPDSILNAVSFPLQLFATKAATIVIEAMSIPAYREGNIVYFAHAHLEIAEACSGLHSLVSITTLSAVFAYMAKKGWKINLILVLSALPIALGANIFRIVTTGILANIYGERVAMGFLHELSGLLVFILGLMILFCEYFLLTRTRRTS
jgi:exosortase